MDDLSANQIKSPLKEERLNGLSPFSIWSKRALLLLGVIATLFFFVLPVGKLVYLSLGTETGFGLGYYAALLQQPRFWSTMQNTCIIVLATTFLSIGFGTLAAWMMAYSNISYKKLLHLLILLSFILPSYVLTLSWSSFMGTKGLMASFLQWFDPGAKPWSMYSMGGIIFVMSVHHFPLVYLFTVNVFKKIPRDLEWAAKAGGAGSLKTFIRVTLPLALPGVAAGGLLVFLASLDNFGIPAFLGTPVNMSVLSTLIYEEIIGFGPSAFARGAALSVILGVIAVAGTMLQWFFVRKSKSDETVRIDHQPRFDLGRNRWWVNLILWGGLIFITIVPLFSMITLSLKRAYGLSLAWGNLTLDNYAYVLFHNPKIWNSIHNSLMLALGTLAVCLIVGTLFAYARVRRQSKWLRGIELAITVPYTLPGIVFALSMILVWMQPIPGWNPGIYGSTTLLFIAYVCRFLILQIRAGVSAVMQVDPSVEEAARISGAVPWRKWLFILLPLLLPGLLSGMVLVFLTSLTELTVSALLYSSKSQTIGVSIFSLEQAGDTLYSTALSSLIVFLIGIGAVLLGLLEKFLNRKGVAHEH